MGKTNGSTYSGQRLQHYVEEHQRDWDEYIQPLTFAYNTQVYRSTETTPFDLVLTRPPSGLELRSIVPQYTVSSTEEPRTLVIDFDKKVRFRPFIAVGDFVYVDRPPRLLTSTERGDLPSDGGEPSVNLLPKTEGPFRVRSATETTVFVDQYGVSNRVSIDRVTQMPRGPHDTTVAAPETDPQAGIPNSPAEYVVDHLIAHRAARSGSQ